MISNLEKQTAMRKNLWIGLIWAVVAILAQVYGEGFSDKKSAFLNNFLFCLDWHQFSAGALTAIGLCSYQKEFRLSVSYLASFESLLLKWVYGLFVATVVTSIAGFFECDITQLSLKTLLATCSIISWIYFCLKLLQKSPLSPHFLSIRLSTT